MRTQSQIKEKTHTKVRNSKKGGINIRFIDSFFVFHLVCVLMYSSRGRSRSTFVSSSSNANDMQMVPCFSGFVGLWRTSHKSLGCVASL